MNVVFLLAESILLSVLLLGAFRLRHIMGLGPVVAVVASLQLMQPILSRSFYWEVFDGVSASRGSCVLFAGNLAIVIYAFARDGTLAARTLLYGIIIANGAVTVLGSLIAWHANVMPHTNMLGIPIAIFETNAVFAVVGIVMLYVDHLLAVMAYAWVERRWPRLPAILVFTTVLIATLAFDTVGYLVPLFWGSPNLLSMVVSGILTKAAVGAFVGLSWGVILRRRGVEEGRELSTIMSVMMFREDLHSLREAAATDALTGLLNRRSYDHIVGQVVSSDVDQFGEGPALILCDADYFKEVNDNLGHAAGDQVLCSIAAALTEATRGDDFCFRLGGDEFAVLLPRGGPVAARSVADRIGTFRFDHPGLANTVTLTLGVATMPEDGTCAESLFGVADSRLYMGKRAGRSAVISSGFIAARSPRSSPTTRVRHPR